MRYAGGGLILMLLIGVGIYLFLQANNAQVVTQQAKPAQKAAVEMSGVGLRESFTMKPVEANGKVTGLEITSIDPASPLVDMYGLQKGDVVVEVGPFSFKSDDPEMMKAQLLEVGAHNHPLVILRQGKRMEVEKKGAAAEFLGGGGRTPGGNLNPLQGIPTH